jgi:D-alanyl-D-alanine carboxypeptidase/D-alanyl-D-alanine-endopeptidase (penicillin-binding protein 4)
VGTNAQTISSRITQAYEKFESDQQLKTALSSLYVVNAKTGEVVFNKNGYTGMPTASTLKVITAASAYELLGSEFRYKTEFGHTGKIEKGYLKGMYYVIGSGDPTLGSWRYRSTKPEVLIDSFFNAVKKAGIVKKDLQKAEHLMMDISRYSEDPFNDYWIWQDLGNYYGIGSTAINWRENQFDAVIIPGKSEGDAVKAIRIRPDYTTISLTIINNLKTGKAGSGDQSVFYLKPGSISCNYELNFKGTIPAGVDSFVVSGSFPEPFIYFRDFIGEYNFEKKKAVEFNDRMFRSSSYFRGDTSRFESYRNRFPVYIHISPSMDSMVYWFLKKSINLYGEAFTKTIAYEKNGFGETEKGIELIRNFWKGKGIDPLELKMVDGSGLSPLNRVTTHAQVQVLQYAKTQSWFKGYYDAFPEYNGMKMKSGTINGVKGYCGYQKAADGNEYIFSFLVNNYNGSASTLVNKMYKVLDELK